MIRPAKEVIRFWENPKPNDIELQVMVRKALRIVRPQEYRLVKDSYGEWVRVELDQVMNHVAKHSKDASRWQFIPAIIPTIKHAFPVYDKGAGVTYEARLTVRARKGGTYQRFAFVSAAREKAKGITFRSIVCPTRKGDVERRRRRAGSPRKTRPNPLRQNQYGDLGPRLAGDRAAQRLPGAAPALKHDYSTDGQEGRARLIKSLVAFTVLVGFAWLGTQICQEASESHPVTKPGGD